MPVYWLTKELIFPPAEGAEEGVVAIGGDLSAERLLLAYRSGIFPWYSQGEPVLWWSPDPRFILFPEELKISTSMRQLLRKNVFEVTYNKAFSEVIKKCAVAERKGQDGTWITGDMKQAYIDLHKKGYAHSVEVWDKDELVGGLYGVVLGKCFFGESMFHTANNASKYGFITFVQKLQKEGFVIVDCQVHTRLLESLGARYLERNKFLEIIQENAG